MFRQAAAVVILPIIAGICVGSVEKEEGRSIVPALIVPPTSPTRHQLIWGVGIPIEYHSESLVYGLALKAQYYLADSLDKLKPGYFPGWAGRRRRDVMWDNEMQMKVENFTVPVEVIEEVTRRNREREEEIFESLLRDDAGLSRWDIYNGLEGIAKQ